MLIKVNKDKQASNFLAHVKAIITEAIETAEQGRTAFYYPIPRNEGVNHWALINEVEDQTQESVYSNYGDIKEGCIKFSIRD